MEPAAISLLIAESQSPSNRDYFAVRASQCFSTANGASWLDVALTSAASQAPLGDDTVIDTDTATEPSFPFDQVKSSKSTTKIENDRELRQVLGSHAGTSCRMFFIRQKNSASRLSITSALFESLCQQCDISERIRDYVMCFGLRNGEAEIGPPPLHHHLVYSKQSQQPVGSECMYVLRFVELNHRSTGNPWSIRQTCVYNKFYFDGSYPSNWLFMALTSNAEDQLRSWQAASSRRHTFDILQLHYLLFDFAIGTWRRYLVYLADEIRHQGDRAIIADLDTDIAVATRLEERQYLKQIEDNVTDLVLALTFMLENVDSVTEHIDEILSQLSHHRDYGQSFTLHINLISKGFRDRKRDLVRLNSQAQCLRKKVDSASTLVSNILDLNNGNALKVLALESRAENANMALLTQKSVRDAATVKVLTIVTLVYLPVTVVTNFFSTQFVNSAQESNGDVHLSVIPQTWILFATSIPLTALTIYVWWIFAQREVQGKFPWDWKACLAKIWSTSRIFRRPKNSSTLDLHPLNR